MGYRAFTACDSKYFRDHAPAYIQSCIETETPFTIVVVDAESGSTDASHDLIAQKTKGLGRATVLEKVAEAPINDRVYYACARFIHAAMLMHEDMYTVESLLITDIDCIFMKHLPQPKLPVGLFVRNSLPGTVGWEAEGTKVAAGLVYIESSSVGRNFIRNVAAQITRLPKQWFIDQVALSRVAKTLTEFHTFTQTDMDWEFESDSYIWTGKGNRKYNSLTYVAKKRELEERFKCAF